MSTIKHLKITHESINKMAREDIPQKPVRKQAGFRSRYSTTYPTYVINQLKEKCREYNIPLCIAFVAYEEAFDSVQTQAVLASLQEKGIEYVYSKHLKDIYTNSSMTAHLHKGSNKINIRRGVRQGDTISPKLQHSKAYSSPPKQKNKLAARQTNMDRSMLNMPYRDRKTREKTTVTYVIDQS